MSIETAWCPVIHATVARVTTLEGEVTSVICPEYEASGERCRAKLAVRQGGPLAQLLEHVSEQTLGSRGDRCCLAG